LFQALEPQDFYDMTLQLCSAAAGSQASARVVSVLEGGCGLIFAALLMLTLTLWYRFLLAVTI
jgi:hypothetical protein